MGAPYFPIQSTRKLNTLYVEFLRTGKLLTKQQAKGNIPAHYHNYIVLGVDIGDLNAPDPLSSITNNKTKLVVYCTEHQWRFYTDIRHLFATVGSLVNGSKCPACQGAV